MIDTYQLTQIPTTNGKITMKKRLLSAICTSLLTLSSVAGAAGQTVLAQIPIPPSSGDGQVVANPALNLVYAAGGFTAFGIEPNIRLLAEATKSFGFFDNNPDADGTMRHALLLVRYQDRDFFPSLPFILDES